LNRHYIENDEDALKIGPLTLSNRLILGTGGAPSHRVISETIRASGAEMVTVAIRRFDPTLRDGSIFEELAKLSVHVLPNTAGCFGARDAVLTAELGREALQTDLVKVEVISDQDTLLPDPLELARATEELVKRGFYVFAYTNDDPALASHLANLGATAVMPLGSPIGSGLGILNPHNIELIAERIECPVVLDAGIGCASDAAFAMELGCDAVLAASAITRAKVPKSMAKSISMAVRAGRLSYLSGRIPRRRLAQASTTDEGKPFT
jgi:thiazole synthase